jgi:hypothetical protein
MARQLSRDEYTVGWVCALPIELAAAQEMLDEEHQDLHCDPADNDENLYALGTHWQQPRGGGSNTDAGDLQGHPLWADGRHWRRCPQH